MNTTPFRRNEGQTLVQVALSMVVLLAFVALAVDVGHFYGERRNMQNAADAGALAGAREICFGNPANALTVAEQWAEPPHNRAQSATAALTPNAWTVTVTATESVNTFLASVIGITDADVSAIAAAACGSADVACGLWPIAFSLDVWNNLYNGGAGCGRSFYVWNGNNGNRALDCTIYDCDLDDDGRNDVVADLGRAWLDFSDVADPLYPSCAAPGCGANEMNCWIQDDSGSPIQLGNACIPGDNGVRASAQNPVNSRSGDIISIPLFDYSGCTGISCPGGNTYHIGGLGCIEVADPGWIQSFSLPRLPTAGPGPDWNGKVIEASVSCDDSCVTSCGGTTGGPPVPGGVNAVSLIR